MSSIKLARTSDGSLHDVYEANFYSGGYMIQITLSPSDTKSPTHFSVMTDELQQFDTEQDVLTKYPFFGENHIQQRIRRDYKEITKAIEDTMDTHPDQMELRLLYQPYSEPGDPPASIQVGAICEKLREKGIPTSFECSEEKWYLTVNLLFLYCSDL